MSLLLALYLVYMQECSLDQRLPDLPYVPVDDRESRDQRKAHSY